jgi:hypothetical protein
MIRLGVLIVEWTLVLTAAVVWTFASKSKPSWFTAGLLVVALGWLSQALRQLGLEEAAVIAAVAAIGTALIKGALAIWRRQKETG